MIRRPRTLAFIAAVTLTVSAIAAPGKLDNRQREAVGRAGGHTREVAKELPEVKKVQETLESAADPSKVPPQTIKDLTEQLKRLQNRLEFADRALRNVSDDHADVKAAKATVAEQQAAIAAATAAIEKITAQQKAVRNPANYPNMKADIETLQTLRKAYALFSFVRDPKHLEDMVARFAIDVKAAEAIYEKYRPLIELGTDDGKDLKAYHKNLTETFDEFRMAARKFGATAPPTIEKALADALKMAETAAEKKKPAFFEGGVEQQMEIARSHLKAYLVLANEENKVAPVLVAKLAEHEKKIAVLKDSLKEQILAETKAPDDVYSKADKKALMDLVLKDWKKRYPNDEILSVRFFQPEWKRSTGLSWSAGNSAWEKYDYSDLRCRVIVKKDDRLATLYYCSLRTDHMAGDQIKPEPHKGGLFIVEDMLMSNFTSTASASAE